jgi:hypothetical protein
MQPPAPLPTMMILAALALAMLVRPPSEEMRLARAGDVPITERPGGAGFWSGECAAHQRWSRFYGKCVRDTSF